MAKIHETLQLMQAGARANKYRVVYPMFSKALDISCVSTTMPGKSLSITEVNIKGRTFRLAAEEDVEGTWEMTITNTENHLHRRFFLKLLDAVHSFIAPAYLSDTGVSGSSLSGMNNYGVTAGDRIQNGNYTGDSGVGRFIGGVNDTINTINNAYSDLRAMWGEMTSVSGVGGGAASVKIISDPIISGKYGIQPWYMTDVKVQQLDHNDKPTATVILHNCFVSSVGPVEYGDDASNQISTTSITFTYSGLTFGDYDEAAACNAF